MARFSLTLTLPVDSPAEADKLLAGYDVTRVAPYDDYYGFPVATLEAYSLEPFVGILAGDDGMSWEDIARTVASASIV